MVNSSGFTLMWDAPPAEEQNGVIRYYAIHIIEINTSQEYALNSTENQTALYFLHPYYNYTYAVSAVTIELGPFSNATNIQTSQNGMKIFCINSNTFVSIKLMLLVVLFTQHPLDLPLMLMPLQLTQPL